MAVIDINGLKVTYSDTGDGVPVVFVPGVVGRGDWFRHQAAGLADQFRVITYDLRPPRGSCTLDTLADDLARLIQALRAYDAVVVGYSLGALIALKYAVAHPDRCPVLVLCSAAPNYPNIPNAEMAAQLLPEGTKPRGLWRRIREAISGRRTDQDTDDESEAYLARSASQVDSAALNARLKLMPKTDLVPLLPLVEAPTLIVASPTEPPYILSGCQVLQQDIPDASIEVIEGADRFYFHTRHDLFNAIAADYLVETIARF